MRLAVLADIHGNVLALEAVLADLARRGSADRIVDLGDCVSGALWPRETLERLQALGARTVRGNHDRQVATLEPSAMGPSDHHAHAALNAEQRARLGALPLTLNVAPGILACHATPSHDETYLAEAVSGGRLVRDPPDAIARRLGDVGATRIVLCGHSHRTEFVRLPNGVLIVNPGSVGAPGYEDPTEPVHVSEAGSPHARYALLDLPDGSAGEPVVTFLAVPYDNEAAARRAEEQGRPDWAMVLRTGFMHP